MKTLLKNRKASFNFDLIKHYTAGIMLKGSEVKSLREGKGNIGDSYCYFKDDGLYLKSLYIPEYKPAGRNNHDPYRDRKLLLKKQELSSLKGKMEQKGMSVVPVKIILNDSHKIKVEVSLGKGKKNFDKRNRILDKQIDRETKEKINSLK